MTKHKSKRIQRRSSNNIINRRSRDIPTQEIVITSKDSSEIELKRKVFNDCYDAVKNIIFSSTTTEEHLIEIVTSLMKLVETYNLKHGEDKKDIVLKVIYKIIDDSTLPENNKRMLKFIPYGIIIDSIVMSANGKFAINVNDKCNKLFSFIC